MSPTTTMDVDSTAIHTNYNVNNDKMEAAVSQLYASLERLKGLLKQNQQTQACLVAESSQFAIRATLSEEEIKRKGEVIAQLDAESLPSSPEENLLKLVRHFLDYKKESLPMVPGRRFPMITSLTLKSVPDLPEFPNLEKVSRGASSAEMVFDFLRDFERRLRNATGSQEVFELLSYPYLKKAITDLDVLGVFERLMAPIKASHAWAWETCRAMFLQAVDQESALGDAIQRLYSISPREGEDYRSFVSRIRELLLQVSPGDNHINLITRIATVISNEGRAKVKTHFGDIQKIPSLDALLGFLGDQVNSPFGPRSSGYRPSPQIQAEARQRYRSAAHMGNTTKLGNDRTFKRPRTNTAPNDTKNASSTPTSGMNSNSTANSIKKKYCHFCKKAGHEKLECFKWIKKQDTQGTPKTGFAGNSGSGTAPNRAPVSGGFTKPVKVNMVVSKKRARTADDFDNLYGRAGSDLGPLYTTGILNENEVMNKVPDYADWYVNASPTVSGVNAIIDSAANLDDFAAVHISINGHPTIAMVDTGADITIIDRSLARSLSIAHAKIDAFVVVAIGSQQTISIWTQVFGSA
ncbi:hypothetical protein BGZ51_004576 [Haplosporangium sp. Z 767]|nr:hypothetical protein BGZ51_004576 [Haplosporangium sp. Z 767]